MKNILFLSFIGLLVVAFNSWASAIPDHGRILELHNRFSGLFNEKAVKDLKLDSQKEKEVLKILAEGVQQRKLLVQEITNLSIKIEEEKKKKPADELKIATWIEELEDIPKKHFKIRKERNQELRKILPAQKYAKFIIISHEGRKQFISTIKTVLDKYLEKEKSAKKVN